MTQPVVLIIARGFPPYIQSLGGAIRILKLAQHLLDQGIETHILAAKGREYGDFGYGELLRRLDVTYVPDPVLRLAAGGETGAGGAAGAAPSFASRLKQWLKPVVLEGAVPDIGIFGVPRLAAAAEAIVRRHGVTTVISSGPPHSDHLVARRLRRRFPQLRWIVDYRDSWNGTALFRKRSSLLQALNLALERRVLREADVITVISDPMVGKAMAIEGPAADRGRYHIVMNGFDSALPVDPAHWRNDGGPLRIGYFGGIDDRPDSYRNPSTLFEAIAANPGVTLDLYGSARISEAWCQRLGDRLRLLGNLSHDTAVKRMVDYDVLMLLHTHLIGADEVVTGKVFEYIASGRPILSVGPDEMAVNRLLAASDGFHAVRNDRAAIAATLDALVAAKRAGGLLPRSREVIAGFTREAQYRRLQALLR